MFAVPTYAFIAAIVALVVAGPVHAAGRGFHPVPVRHLAMVQAVTVLLVLRAFAAGATARVWPAPCAAFRGCDAGKPSGG